MKLSTLVTIGTLSVVLNAQQPSTQAQQDNEPKVSSVKILYTGRLLGYMRTPDKQGLTTSIPCPGSAAGLKDGSDQVCSYWPKDRDPNSILVGMGDNFAPELEARLVYAAGKPPAVKDRTGSDLHSAKDDNVVEFLVAAHYNALVPGKEDFYFGPERLRKIGEILSKSASGPKLLGANLAYVVKPTKNVDRVETAAEPDKSVPSFTFDSDNLLPYAPTWRITLNSPAESKDQNSSKPQSAEIRSSAISPQDYGDSIGTLIIPQECTGKCAFHLSRGTLDKIAAHPEGNYQLCLFFDNVDEKKQPPKSTCQPVPLVRTFFSGLPYAYDSDRNTVVFGAVDANLQSQIAADNARWKSKDLTANLTVLAPDEALRQAMDRFAFEHSKFNGFKVLLAQMNSAEAQELSAHLRCSHAGDDRMQGDLAADAASGTKQYDESNYCFDIVISRAEDAHATGNLTLSADERPVPTVVVTPHPFYSPEHHGFVQPISSLQLSRSTGGAGDACGKGGGAGWCLKNEYKEQPLGQARTAAANGLVARLVPGGGIETEGTSAAAAAIGKSISLKSILCGDAAKCTSEQIALKALRSILEDRKASVALLQKRDFFEFDIPDTVSAEEVQQVLDRVVWKQDLISTINVTGAALKKAMEASKKYEDEERSATTPVDTAGRALVSVGILKRGKDYYVNGDALDSGKIYRIVTSNHITDSDTGYSDLTDAAVDKVHVFDAGQAFYISSSLCQTVFRKAKGNAVCSDPVQESSYVPGLPGGVSATPDNRKIAGYGTKLAKALKKDPAPFDGPDPEKTFQRRGFWHLEVSEITGSFNWSNPDQPNVSNLFAGVTEPNVSDKAKQKEKFGLHVRDIHKTPAFDIGYEVKIEAERDRQGKQGDDSPPSISQPSNSMTFGPVLQTSLFKSRDNGWGQLSLRPADFSFQPFATKLDFFVGPNKVKLPVDLHRDRSLSHKVGWRIDRPDNWIEIGGQFLNDFTLLDTLTVQGKPPCVLSATEDLTDCLKMATKSLTEPVPVSQHRSSRLQGGTYLDMQIKVPLPAQSIKYVTTSQASWFPTNKADDLPTETHYIVNYDNGVEFAVWKGLSLQPTYHMIWYENKKDYNDVWRKGFDVQLKWSFAREAGVRWRDAIRYKGSGGN